jgi:hypothetical protein
MLGVGLVERPPRVVVELMAVEAFRLWSRKGRNPR